MPRRTAFLALLLAPSLAMAQTPAASQTKPVEAIPPGEDRIEVLTEGAPAPYTGQLFDNVTALRWANWLVQYKYRLALDVQEQKDLCTERTKELQRNIQIEQEKYAKVVTAYDQKLIDLAASTEPSWYETPWIGFVAGIVLTTAATGVIVWAANSGD